MITENETFKNIPMEIATLNGVSKLVVGMDDFEKAVRDIYESRGSCKDCMFAEHFDGIIHCSVGGFDEVNLDFFCADFKRGSK